MLYNDLSVRKLLNFFLKNLKSSKWLLICNGKLSGTRVFPQHLWSTQTFLEFLQYAVHCGARIIRFNVSYVVKSKSRSYSRSCQIIMRTLKLVMFNLTPPFNDIRQKIFLTCLCCKLVGRRWCIVTTGEIHVTTLPISTLVLTPRNLLLKQQSANKRRQ